MQKALKEQLLEERSGMDKLIITNAGTKMQTDLLRGAKASFTKVEATNREYSESDAKTITRLEGLVKAIDISAIKAVDDTTIKITARFGNGDLGQEYTVNTLALYAETEDGDEVLYAVSLAGDNPDKMPPSSLPSYITYHMFINVADSSMIAIEVSKPSEFEADGITITLDEKRGVISVAKPVMEKIEKINDVDAINARLEKAQYDLTEVIFQMSVRSLTDNSKFRNVIVDKIDSKEAVNLVSGSYASGKVYI